VGKWSGPRSRVSALARSALAAHASPGPRGDAPARVGVRDLVEVDLGECATVNVLHSYSNYHGLILIPRRTAVAVVGRLPFGLNSGSPIPNGLLCSVPSSARTLVSASGYRLSDAKIAYGRVSGGAGAGVRRPRPGRGDPDAGRGVGRAILCMPYHLAHIVTLSDAPFPRRALPVSHRRLTGVALWGGTHTARRPNRGHAGSSPSGRAPAQRASNAARARRSTS
jgi:hypothetical protein